MLIIIEGKQGCGKTTTALDLIGKDIHITLPNHYIRNVWRFNEVVVTTKWILVEEVTPTTMREWLKIFRNEKLRIRKPMKLNEFIPMPNVILIMQT